MNNERMRCILRNKSDEEYFCQYFSNKFKKIESINRSVSFTAILFVTIY